MSTRPVKLGCRTLSFAANLCLPALFMLDCRAWTPNSVSSGGAPPAFVAVAVAIAVAEPGPQPVDLAS
eukprot:1080452-Pleurochrysis_carterae.AAC.3